MVIDSHAHVMLPVEEHIRLMDEAGVDKTILFSTSIHPEKAENKAEFTKEMRLLGDIVTGKRNANETKALANEENYSVIARHPERFIGFGSIPHGLGYAETGAWVEKQIDDYHFIGLGEFTIPSGGVEALRNSFLLAQTYGNLPIWIHAFFPLNLADIRGIAELGKGFATVPVIIGHLGGVHWLDVIGMVQECRNVYLDLSAAFTTIAVKMAIREIPERCLFSSDMPYGDVMLARLTVERVCPDLAIRKLVLGDNIARIIAERGCR